MQSSRLALSHRRQHLPRPASPRQRDRRLTKQLGVFALLAPSPDGRDLHARAWLASALSRLDPALRATIVLVAGEDMSHAEVANALGVAESTISWRMRQARRLLAAEPEEEADHGP
jgi:RNA polymerase sigma-70 factor (ECF subfamily)